MGNSTSEIFTGLLYSVNLSGFFCLDTGASVNVLSREIALEVSKLRDVGKVLRGVSGATQTYLADDVSLQKGHLCRGNKGIYAIDLKDMSHELEFEISGFFGHPMLKNLVITNDLRDGLIDFQYPFEGTPKSK